MARTIYHGAVAVGTSAANSDAIDLDGQDCLIVEIPNGSSITSLTAHVNCRPPDSTPVFQAFYDSANAAVTQTVAADQTHVVKTDINGAGQVKLVGDAAGTVYVTSKRMGS